MRYIWTSKKALGLILLFAGLGYVLFWCWQPQCEPCLADMDCPPCISQEQYFIAGSTTLLIVIALLQIIVLKR